MAKVTVNGTAIEIGDDEQLNGIEVARMAGVDVPHYCWHPGLSVVASCRMCLVETGRVNAETGQTQMVPKLVPACQTPATDGTVFITDSEKVKNARAMVEEDLLIRHPIDCPICDKAGECALQDYHFEHGRDQRRADIKPFTSRRRELGETVTLFVDRCVMCSRCVRFCREATGTAELMVENRGAHEEINVFPGFPLDNKLSGNVVDLCPVGALGDRDFLYEQRVWFMQGHDHVCGGCSTGCSIRVDENQDQIYRLKPRENPDVNQWWMCDEGRYGWKHVHDQGRLVSPQVRRGETIENLEWSQAPHVLYEALAAAVKTSPAPVSPLGPSTPPKDEAAPSKRLGVVLSPHLTVEEAYLLAEYIRSIDPQAVVATGPVPVEGEDETFPNGFVIHAEKCPNRNGVEAVAAQYDAISWEAFLDKAEAGDITAAWITGGYKTDWNDEATAARFAGLDTLIVQDTFDSPLYQAATHQLPGAAFAERAGSYVNYNHWLQSFDWAIRAPAGVMVEGQLYWRLAQRNGLYNAPAVLQEIAAKIPAFAAAAGEVPAKGVALNQNETAPATASS